MTNHKSQSNAVPDKQRKEIAALNKLRRKRSAMIKEVAQASAELDALRKISNRPCIPAEFDTDKAWQF